MSDDGGKGTGGADPNAGGGPGKETNSNDNPDGGKKTFSQEFVDQLMTEKKNASKRAQDAETWKNEREVRDKETKDAELKKQGKFKEALDEKEKELAGLKDQVAEGKKQRVDSRKLSHFLDGLEGDLKKSYWNLVDIDSIKVDDDGQPMADSVKAAIDKFRVDYPEIIGKKAGPGMNPGDPKPPGSGKISHETWKKLPLKEMKSRLKDVEGLPEAP